MTQLLQNQKQPRMPLIQRKLKQENLNKMKADHPDAFQQEDFEKAVGDDGKFTDVQADKGLPTFWGMLKEVFGEKNLNAKVFAKTKNQLGDTCDRPHSVTALITKSASKNGREGLKLVTAIGNLGDEEIFMREGAITGLLASYEGGHLIGYQILRGQGADQEWNVAPQDAKNNKESYNNTIEEMLREAKIGTKYEYTVEVKYDQLNFSVDQDQLLQLGILKKIDADKPWEIQLPVRIPFKWEAKAEMLNDGQFGCPTAGDSSYDQYSENMDEGNLDYTESDYTARYHLWYSVNRGEDKDYTSSDLEDTKGVTGVRFSMHQALMSDHAKNKDPIAWKGRERVADYGSVQDGLVAESAGIRKAIDNMYEKNRQDFNEFEAMEDADQPEDFELAPADVMDKMVDEGYKSCFIKELRDANIEVEYDELKYANENYLGSFSVKDDDMKLLELEKDHLKDIETKINAKDISTGLLKECKAMLQKQSRVLRVILNHKRERMTYSKIVKKTRPIYQKKWGGAVEKSIAAHERLKRMKMKKRKTWSDEKILLDFERNKNNCRRIETFDGYLKEEILLREIDTE
ncbi:DNA/RNA non-specific endonuclease [Brevibacillus formosus]|uniref:DNA/RNA non-specific endonuclease n=2 Tax=Brevibacillus formosus TaxID=54913 RepID=UPI001F54CDD4|nr:DNA/RNA non-specific endonuclease [Brevibacillus formosus]